MDHTDEFHLLLASIASHDHSRYASHLLEFCSFTSSGAGKGTYYL